jgi:hypothetical protein
MVKKRCFSIQLLGNPDSPQGALTFIPVVVGEVVDLLSFLHRSSLVAVEVQWALIPPQLGPWAPLLQAVFVWEVEAMIS